jgi:hypothetical protein
LVAEQLSTVPIVSSVSVVEPHPVDVEMPDSGSLTAHEIIVLVLFQPARGSGVTVGTITGCVMSTGMAGLTVVGSSSVLLLGSESPAV